MHAVPHGRLGDAKAVLEVPLLLATKGEQGADPPGDALTVW